MCKLLLLLYIPLTTLYHIIGINYIVYNRLYTLIGVLLVSILVYSERCSAAAVSPAPGGTTELHTEVPRILLLHACAVFIVTAEYGTNRICDTILQLGYPVHYSVLAFSWVP